MTDEDMPFIFSTWLKNNYHGQPYWRSMNRDAYFALYKAKVAYLLARCQVTMCCLADDPDVVLGYSVYEPSILHWVYVKKAWRELGIAKSLVPSDVEACSHLTLNAKKILPSGWTFNPFLGD